MDQTIEYKGYKIEVSVDQFPDNPLEWADADDREGRVAFTMVHRRYDVPNETDTDWDEYANMEEAGEAVKADRKAKELQFVKWYEHSGIAVSLTDESTAGGFDSGIVGFITGDTIDDIKSYFEEWKHYIEGDTYLVQIMDPDEGDEYVDGGTEYDIEEGIARAKAQIDLYPAKRESRKAPTAQALHA